MHSPCIAYAACVYILSIPMGSCFQSPIVLDIKPKPLPCYGSYRTSVPIAGASAAPAAGDSDDDMFADSDTEAAPMDQDAPEETRVASEGDSGSKPANAVESAASAKPVSPRTSTGAFSSAAQVQEARSATEEGQANALQTADRSQEQDYLSWPISELRRVLMEAQIDVSGVQCAAQIFKQFHLPSPDN